jgi:ASC-1-like (ASCH) protein
MRLHPEPFALIKSGVKNVECRLYDEKRRELKEGDVIEFQLRPDFVEKFERKITAVHTFPTFEALFTAFPEERVNDVYQYYTPEEEKQFGVVAIELS